MFTERVQSCLPSQSLHCVCVNYCGVAWIRYGQRYGTLCVYQPDLWGRLITADTTSTNHQLIYIHCTKTADYIRDLLFWRSFLTLLEAHGVENYDIGFVYF